MLLPAWFVPGIAGYVIHRRTRIERAERAGDSCADLRAERAQPVRHGIVGEPAVAVERPLRLRHRLHEGNAPARSALTTNSIELIACRPWTPPAVATRPTGLFVR